MISRSNKLFPVVAVCVLALAGFSMMLGAQEHGGSQPAQPASQSQSAQQPHNTPHEVAGSEQQAGTEAGAHSAEAKGHEEAEDEHGKFKYSPVVTWIGQKIGLDKKASYWAFTILNFAILLGAIIFLMKKFGVAQGMRERTAVIQRSMEEARKASEESQQRIAEIEARLARLDSEIAGMRGESEAQFAAEEQRMKAAAGEERRKILEHAEQEIASAGNQARRELKAFAADLAVNLAEKRIQVSPEADRALVEDFAQSLGRDGGRGGR